MDEGAAQQGGGGGSATSANRKGKEKQVQHYGKKRSRESIDGGDNNAAKPAAPAAKAKGKAKAKTGSAKPAASPSSPSSSTTNNNPSAITVAYVPKPGENRESFADAFWKHQIFVAETVHDEFKTPELPLARVKRVMKTDPDIAMIASEVPVILEKACQIFISDLTARAYIASPKRRTLTKADVITATTKDDTFDFLIDVAPRELANPTTSNSAAAAASASSAHNHATSSSSVGTGPGKQNGTTSSNSKKSKSALSASTSATGKKSSSKGKKAAGNVSSHAANNAGNSGGLYVAHTDPSIYNGSPFAAIPGMHLDPATFSMFAGSFGAVGNGGHTAADAGGRYAEDDEDDEEEEEEDDDDDDPEGSSDGD